MTGSVHSHLVQAAGLGGIARMDVVVCALGNACQLVLFSGGVVVGGKALAYHLIHLARQVHGSVIQQFHGVAAAAALDLGVDVIMLGGGVHHQIQDVLLCGIGVRHCIHLLEGCVAGLGNGGVDGLHHLCAGLEGAVVVQLAGLGGHGDVYGLVRVNRLCSAVHLDALDLIGLCANIFQSLNPQIQSFVFCVLALCQVLKVAQCGDVVQIVISHVHCPPQKFRQIVFLLLPALPWADSF